MHLTKRIELDLRADHFTAIQTTNQVWIKNSGNLSGIIVYFDLNMAKTTRLNVHPQAATRANHWASKVWMPGRQINLSAGDRIELTYSWPSDSTGSMFKVKPLSLHDVKSPPANFDP